MKRGKARFETRYLRAVWPAALAVAALAALAVTAEAQRAAPGTPSTKPPTVIPPGGATGVGGGAGLIGPMPNLSPAMPSTTAPPLAAPPAAAPAAPAPARAVRFRCEVAPQDQSCRDPGASDGGGGDDSECNCARDYCHDEADAATGAVRRFCEKQ